MEGTRYLFTVLFLILLSCTSGEQNQSSLDADTSVEKAMPQLARPILTPTKRLRQVRREIGSPRAVTDTKSLITSKPYQQIPKRWVGLQMTDTSYVEYEPCNGINHSLEIRSDTLVVNWTLESSGYFIQNVEEEGGNFSLFCYSANLQEKVNFELQALKESPNSFVISWLEDSRHYRWLVTAEQYRYDFPLVTNKCPDSMVPEKQFREIDFSLLE